MMRRLLLTSLGLALPLASASAACTSLSATNLVFGTYSGASISVTATITVNCTAGFVYTLALNGGVTGNTAARSMTSSPLVSYLNYSMYRDATHLLNWGSNAGIDTLSGIGTGFNQNFIIFGVLPAGQTVNTGNYLDTPTVSIVNGASATFNPTAQIPGSCTVSASNLNFGTYTGSILLNTSSINVNCTNTTGYNVGLDAGTSVGATVTTRAMKGAGSSTLPYQLFRSNTYTNNWGTTIGTDTVAGTGTGVTQTLTVYGRIQAGIYVAPGSYSDTVTVSVTY